MRKAFWTISILAAILCVQAVAKAQDTASVTGIVTDTTGAVIPGASVRLENPATGVAYAATTSALGSYTVANIAPGPGYKLTLSREGFKPVTINGIYLNVDATRTQNVKMSIGTTTETVEVSASAENETLNTSDATVGNNFEASMLNELPVQNRDSPAALFYQQPGVTLDGAVTGARTDQSNVTLDGLEMNDEATGEFGIIVGNAPVDSVEEFRGVTAEPLSSAGQGGGGQFELVTKSGTNDFHGTLVEYHRDTDTEANSWFNDNTNPVTPTPPLVRNQFGGGVGGPIWRNKAFFYFDYDGRRDAISTIEDRTVPLDSYRNGQIRYITSSGGVATLPSAKEFDPKGIGFDQVEQSLFNQRFPHANDLTGDVGDLVNTAGFRFNAPTPLTEDNYVQRVDYNLNSKMKIDGVGHFTRRNDEYGVNQFPGDPITYPRLDRSYAWVANHTWTISGNMVNQAAVGETHEDLAFPVAYNPQGINVYAFAGFGDSGPYGAGNNAQARAYPIPVVRDDFSWEKGRHSLTFGGTFKWESPQSYQAENFFFPSVGVSGNTLFTALNSSLRPKDIGSSNEATTIYDNLYSTALGVLASVGANFNYNNKGQVLTQGSGLHSDYRYYEAEIYAGDTWKVTPDFTVSYGLRYQDYTTPYEIHGSQSVSNIGSFDSYFDARVKQSQGGVEGNSAVPLLSWSLAGKVNNGKPFYQPFDKNFAPRVAFAYNPGFDKKTVFSGGGGVIYDHSVINALIFQERQSSYLFEAGSTSLFGVSGNSNATLQVAPRFGGLNTEPPTPAAPNVTPPFFPFVVNGVPTGLSLGEANLNVDPNLKIPYNVEYNFEMQHEFPQGYLLRLGYVGRLGRRLLAQADASQLIEFPDNSGKSNQTMSQAMGGLTTQLRANAGLGPLGAIQAVKPEPWFEDVIAPGVGAANGFKSNTELIAYDAFPYPQRGDFADAMFLLSAFGLLPPNVGMASQFASQQIFTNKGSSNYNGMLVTLHKNAGYGLQFDLNYTWSHSIDNVSEVANYLAVNTGYGWICDVLRPRECRGNSDFDATNYFNGNFIYDLPIGRGKAIGANAPLWADEAIGGWEISGIPAWHTGNPWTAFSNAFIAGFATNAPAILTGSKAELATHISGGKGQPLNAFSNPTAALADYSGPTGFTIGGRNNLRGPGFFDLDLGVGKTFPIYEDKVSLKFRVDAFNALNHPNFEPPAFTGSAIGTDITQSTGTPFGTISSTDIPPDSDQAARVLQGALRVVF